jgi:hypothetical protein
MAFAHYGILMRRKPVNSLKIGEEEEGEDMKWQK